MAVNFIDEGCRCMIRSRLSEVGYINDSQLIFKDSATATFGYLAQSVPPPKLKMKGLGVATFLVLFAYTLAAPHLAHWHERPDFVKRHIDSISEKRKLKIDEIVHNINDKYGRYPLTEGPNPGYPDYEHYEQQDWWRSVKQGTEPNGGKKSDEHSSESSKYSKEHAEVSHENNSGETDNSELSKGGNSEEGNSENNSKSDTSENSNSQENDSENGRHGLTERQIAALTDFASIIDQLTVLVNSLPAVDEASLLDGNVGNAEQPVNGLQGRQLLPSLGLSNILSNLLSTLNVSSILQNVSSVVQNILTSVINNRPLGNNVINLPADLGGPISISNLQDVLNLPQILLTRLGPILQPLLGNLGTSIINIVSRLISTLSGVVNPTTTTAAPASGLLGLSFFRSIDDKIVGVPVKDVDSNKPAVSAEDEGSSNSNVHDDSSNGPANNNYGSNADSEPQNHSNSGDNSAALFNLPEDDNKVH